MKRQLTAAAVKDYTEAPPAVQIAFDKQVKLLVENFRHPSLRAKKYDESRNVWQARVNRDWRFYFLITTATPPTGLPAFATVGLAFGAEPTDNSKDELMRADLRVTEPQPPFAWINAIWRRRGRACPTRRPAG